MINKENNHTLIIVKLQLNNMKIESILYCCQKGKEIKEDIENVEFEVVERGQEVEGPFIDMVKSNENYKLKIYCEEHSPEEA